MIIRGVTFFSRLAVSLVMLFAFTACGGGGGGGGGFLGGGSADELTLTLFDPNGDRTSTITPSSPGTLRVKAGSQKDVVITASTTLGAIFPATALTDNNGVATFQLEAGNQRGAGTINASATVDGTNLTGTLGFQVGDPGLRLGFFDDDGMFVEGQIKIEPESSLSAGGNAQLSVVIVDGDGQRVITTEEVRYNSSCIAAGQAAINPSPVTSVNGEAATLYTASGCAGTDQVTASLVGTESQAFGTLTLAAPTANAVNFISAEPTLIVLRGTGGVNRDETADIVFNIADSTGAPLSGVEVSFNLSTDVGGISLSKESTLSDGDGNATVTVSSGDVATVVRVTATVDGGDGEPVSTVSDQITVTTGLPDQNSISLAVADSFVVEEGMVEDGLTRTLTVAMADKFNNPVVDGTAAVFTTEYGSIVGSCTTVDGTCSVEWRSQEPRYPTLSGDDFVRTILDSDYDCPSHNGSVGPCPDDLGYTRGGRSTILVHAIGEESFIDRNGNGIMDQEERLLFENLPEAFIDHNEDGVYTPADPACVGNNTDPRCIAGFEEIFVDFNANDAYDFNDEPAVYNGLLCPPEGDGVWCSRELVHVRADNVVSLASPTWYLVLVNANNGAVVNSVSPGIPYIAYISDIHNTPPPAGSTISFSGEDDCDVPGNGSTDVLNIFDTGAVEVGLSVTESNFQEAGSLTVSLDTPDGLTVNFAPYSCGEAVDCSATADPRDSRCPPLPMP